MTAREYYDRGVEFFNQDNYDQAVLNFKEAYQLEPNNAAIINNLAVAYNNRGITLFQSGNCEQAIADFNEAVRLNPNDPDNYRARGFIYNEMKDFDKAISDFTEVIRLDPSVEAYNGRIMAYLGKCGEYLKAGDESNQRKYYDLVIEDYKAALKIEPDNAMVKNNLDDAMEKRKQWWPTA